MKNKYEYLCVHIIQPVLVMHYHSLWKDFVCHSDSSVETKWKDLYFIYFHNLLKWNVWYIVNEMEQYGHM